MFIGCREVAFARYIMLLKDLLSAPYNSLFIAAPGVAKATHAAPRGLNAPGAATGARWGVELRDFIGLMILEVILSLIFTRFNILSTFAVKKKLKREPVPEAPAPTKNKYCNTYFNFIMVCV